MAWHKGGILLFVATLLAATWSCSSDSTDPNFNNPFDPRNGQGLPVPDSVQVTVGNNRVVLQWSLPEGETAEEYAVFRRDVSEDTDQRYRLLATITKMTYDDTGVRNGRRYGYKIAAGRNNQFGERTEEIEANPGLFTLVLAGEAPKTSTRSIVVSLSGTLDTQTVQLSEDPGFASATWRQFAPSITWTLSSPDGEKVVYGRFGLSDGSQSDVIMDSIVLDTRAVIRAVVFDGESDKDPGDIVHFRVEAGEPGGSATIDVTNVFTSLPLFDDGTNGDTTPGDGIYERNAIIPSGNTVSQAVVRGRFTDDVGNQAAPLDAVRTITILETPASVDFLSAVPAELPDPAAVVLRWTQSQDANFSSYSILRSETATVDLSDRLVATVTSRTSLTTTDNQVAEGITYAYRVYVNSAAGTEAGSNSLSVLVPNLRSPTAVTAQSPTDVSFTRIALGWSKNTDLDFSQYVIRRNEIGAVSDSDPIVGSISDVDQTSFDDTGLRENTTYYYRIFVEDTGGLESRSNEVQGTTRNDPPPGVTLNAASDITSTEATLSWGESSVHDFAFYRLYRDTLSTVNTASTLVVEIDEPEATSYRDNDLTTDSQYYYRVYVVDDGKNPGPESTGSNTVSLTTP